MFARSRNMLRAVGLAAAALASVQLLLAAAGSSAAAAERAADNPVVVELFTSQGCSSCPPADRLLAELADKPGVIALSLHVDYWDYIGWQDPFGRPEATRRQRGYMAALDSRFLYTPQIVVDGRSEMVGSHRGEVERAVAAAAEKPKPLEVRIADDGRGRAKVVVPAGEAAEPAAVWLAVYDRAHETAVARGENAGRTLVNRNVVRELERLATWRGERLELSLDTAAAAAAGRDACAVLVQEGGHGRILGAAAMPLDDISGG